MSSDGGDGGGIVSLLRWRPVLIGLTAVAATVSLYYAAVDRGGTGEDEGSQRGLRRSNAVRRRSPRLRHVRTNIAGSRSSNATTTQATALDTSANANHETDDDSDYDPTASIAGGIEGGQSLLNLLYHIAEEQAHREGYVHRGVTCNSCATMPIRGVRYRCANCPDYDLCEQCENLGVHDKTHLFYKIRIPAPFLGPNPRNQQPVWYPGKSYGLPQTLPKELRARFMELTGFERSRVDALWEQFKSLAAVDWHNDPNGLKIAIDRKVWAKYCMPTMLREHEPSSALIFDRSFTYYDDNDDGLVGFEEFLGGLAAKYGKDQEDKLRRIFRAQDLDGDGLISRDDLMKLFNSHYSFTRELSRDLFNVMCEEILDDRSLRENLRGTQPVSSCFTGNIPPGESSRIGEGKTMNSTGDWIVTDGGDFLRDSDAGPGPDQADRRPDQSSSGVMADIFSDLDQPMPEWPPAYVTIDDAQAALGKLESLELVTSASAQRRVLDAAHRRLGGEQQQLSFADTSDKKDSKDMTPVASSTAPTTADGSANSILSVRDTSQTESQQREAQEGNTHEELMTDGSFSQEYLLQAMREGFQELLDPMFKQLEDLYDLYERSTAERMRLHNEMRKYRASTENTALAKGWLCKSLRDWRRGEVKESGWYGDKLAEEILQKLMKENEIASSEWVDQIHDKIDLGFMTEQALNVHLEELAKSKAESSKAIAHHIKHLWRSSRSSKNEEPSQSKEQLSKVNDTTENAPGQDKDGTVLATDNELGGLVQSLNQRLQQAHERGSHSGPDNLEQQYWITESEFNSFLTEFRSQNSGTTNGQPDINSAVFDSAMFTAPGTVTQSSAQDTNNRESDLVLGSSDSTIQEQGTTILNATLNAPGEDLELVVNIPLEDLMDVEPVLDPMLPQNRPNSLADLEAIQKADLGHLNKQDTAREKSQRYLRWSSVNQQGSILSMEQQDPFEDQDSSYFQVKLKYLTLLELFAEHCDIRKGVARLNHTEFEEIMLGQKGRRLGIIGGWLDLAAF